MAAAAAVKEREELMVTSVDSDVDTHLALYQVSQPRDYISREAQVKCILITTVCVCVSVPVPRHMPALLHASGCNAGEW